MSTAEQKPFAENPDVIETAELPVFQEGGSEGAVTAVEEPEEVPAAPEGESLVDSLKRNPLNTDITRYRSRDALTSDGSEMPSSREIHARREAAKKEAAEAEARQAVEEATTPEANEPQEAAIPVNKGMPKLPEMPRAVKKAAEKPTEPVTEPEATPAPEAQPEPVQPESPAPRRGRAARRGRVATVPQAPAEAPAPEAVQPAATPEKEPIPLNTATAPDVKDVLAATYAAQERQLPKNPLERPNVNGEDAASIGQRQSYAVQFSNPVPTRVQESLSTSTAEEVPEPVAVTEPKEAGGLDSHLSPEALARLAAFKTSLPEATPKPESTSEATPEPKEPEVDTATPSASTNNVDHFAHLFRPETNAAAGPTSEPEVQSEPEAEPGRRRRHARETPAGLTERLLGFTSSRTPDAETTQPISTISAGEAEPAADSSATGETTPRLSRMQRMRAKIGSMATAIGSLSNFEQDRELRRLGVMPANSRPGIVPGMSKAERKLEQRRQEIEADTDSETDQNFGIFSAHAMSAEEIAERQRTAGTRGARRAKIVAGLGLAAAAAGLVGTLNADTANESRPRAPISANQLPGQQQETNESSLAARAKEALADAQDRLREAGEKPSTPQTPEKSEKTVRTDHENITIGNDGSVTVELRQGGNYWEGVHEAEQMLDIDDSATATANAVNTIGFEEGEDRNQKVGSKITFKNVNGKLVAVRS